MRKEMEEKKMEEEEGEEVNGVYKRDKVCVFVCLCVFSGVFISFCYPFVSSLCIRDF